MAVIMDASAQVYKCTDVDGKIVYQQQSCEGGKTEATVRIDSPSSTESDKYPGNPGLDNDAAIVILMKQTCDDAVPGFRDRTTDDYAIWRSKHYASVVRIENNPDFRSSVEKIRKQNAVNLTEAAVRMKPGCDGYADRLAREAQGPDPRFASSEKTWETWLTSLRRGDRENAKRCLTDTARSKFDSILKQGTPDELKSMADAIRTFKITVGFGKCEKHSQPERMAVVALSIS